MHLPSLVDDRNSWMRQVDMFIEVITCTIYCIVVAEYIAKEAIRRTFLRIIYHQFVRIWGELRDHWQQSSIKSRDTLLRFIILWGHPHHTDAITNAFFRIYVATFLTFVAKTNLMNIFVTIYRATHWIWNHYEVFNLHIDRKMIAMKNGIFYIWEINRPRTAVIILIIPRQSSNTWWVSEWFGHIVVNHFFKVQSFNLLLIYDTK